MASNKTTKVESSITIILIVIFVLLTIWIFSGWLNTTANFIDIDYSKDRVFYLPELISPTTP